MILTMSYSAVVLQGCLRFDTQVLHGFYRVVKGKLLVCYTDVEVVLQDCLCSGGLQRCYSALPM